MSYRTRRDSRSNSSAFVALAVVIGAALSLGGLLIVYFSQAGKNPGVPPVATAGKTPQTASARTDSPAIQTTTSASRPPAGQRKTAASKVVEKSPSTPAEVALAFTSFPAKDRFRLVNDGESIRSQIADYYDDHPPVLDGVTHTAGSSVEVGQNAEAVPVTTAEKGFKPTTRLIYCRCVGGRWLVDWEATTGYNGEPLKVAMAAATAGKVATFRLTAEISDYYRFIFSEAKPTHVSVSLKDTAGSSMNGYARRDSVLGRDLLALLADGKTHPVVVTLRWVESDGEVAEIVKLEGKTWFRPDP